MNIKAILNAKIIKKPFPYAIVKNLFGEEEFLQLSSFATKFQNDKREFLDKKWKNHKYNTPDLIGGMSRRNKYPSISLHYKHWDELGFDSSKGGQWRKNVFEHKDEILTRFRQRRFGKTYGVQVFFNFAPPEARFPIHHDSTPKAWTIAHYLSPQQNTGTILYDGEKKLAKEAPWELNTGCAFCPCSGVSWHSYKNSSPTDYRVVLIINIIRRGVV